jgi:MoxR-like ATPase
MQSEKLNGEYIGASTVKIDNVPSSISIFMPDNEFKSIYFDNVTIGDKVSFDVWVRGKRGIRIIEESIVKTNTDTPTLDGWTDVQGVWFNDEELALFEAASIHASNGGGQYNFTISGDSGYGKTARGQAWATEKEMDHVRVNCGLINTPEKWFFRAGVTETEQGNSVTVVHETPFTKAIEKGNAVIVLDEFNRTPAAAKNPLFPLLDDARETTVTVPAGNEGNRTIKCGDNILFIATVNEGYKFTGTYAEDSALRKRFSSQIKVDQPPKEVESRIIQDRTGLAKRDAEKIVVVLHWLRDLESLKDSDIDITTRKAIQIAEVMQTGRDIDFAFKVCVINTSVEDLPKAIVDKIRETM